MTHKSLYKYILIGICLVYSGKSFSQSAQTIVQVAAFLNDATFYLNKFITPATDAAVYQASSGWMTSPKERKLFDVTLGLHGNVFFVPRSDRSFDIKNSDFSFFTIENQTSATVPTALGGSSSYYLVGQLDNNQVRIQTPNGVNQESIVYPYLQGSVSLWKGFEVIGKYSAKVKLKSGDYQVYGFGLKHNFSQYLKSLEKRQIHLAGLLAYSNEQISFDFVDANTSYGNLGINRISGDVDTWQFQISASKEWKNFELMLSSVTNTSDFKYRLSGKGGSLPIQGLLNEKIKELYTTKINSIGEISGRYQFSKFYVQTLLAFGKFANLNLSVQYEF